MHRTLICVEKNDFRRLVDISRQYAGGDLKKCYVFNKKGYTAEFYKEKIINGINCVIFGWSKYDLILEGLQHGYDLTGINCEINRMKNGYILMEFEGEMLVNFRERSKIDELKKAINIDRIVTKDDFSLVYEEEEGEEFE